MQLGARATGKLVTSPVDLPEPIDVKEFDTLLKPKLKPFNFLQLDIEGSKVSFSSFSNYKIGDYIRLIISATPTFNSTDIYLSDDLTGKDLKKTTIYGTVADMTDAIAGICSTNSSLFNQISSTRTPSNEMPVSIKILYNNKEAIKIKKAMLGGEIASAHAILLSALETSQPVDRLKEIQNIVNILNQYLKDDYYINAAQFNNTNPQYFQFPGSSIRTRIR